MSTREEQVRPELHRLFETAGFEISLRTLVAWGRERWTTDRPEIIELMFVLLQSAQTLYEHRHLFDDG